MSTGEDRFVVASSTMVEGRKARRRVAWKTHLGVISLLGPIIVLLAGVYVVPLGQVVALSFDAPGSFVGNYADIVTDPVLTTVLGRTFGLAFRVTFLCLVFGYAVAYLMVRTSSGTRRVLWLLVFLPMWISILVRSYAWMVILGRHGIVNESFVSLGLIDEPLQLLYSPFSVYVGMVHIMLPFMILPLYAVMQRIDMRLVSAAQSLGAGRLVSFIAILLPLSMPGVLSGSLLVFIISLGFFITPALLGGLEDITYVLLIERQVNHLHNWPRAAAMSVVLLIATLVLVAGFQRLFLSRNSTSDGVTASRRALLGAGLPLRWAIRAAQMVEGGRWAGSAHPAAAKRAAISSSDVLGWAVVGFLCAPMMILFPLAFSSADFLQFPPPGFSFRWFEKFFSRGDWTGPAITSFQVAAATTVGATLIGTLAAIALVRGRLPLRGVITAFVLSPLIVPTIIMAIAVYFFFARLGLVGTMAGLMLAHLVLAVPYVVIVVSSTLQTVDESLERAACTLGATPVRAFVRVTLPLIAPGVMASALFAFLVSFDELVIALFISGTTAKTLPKRMWDGIREEIDPTIAAVATVLILLSIVFVVATEWARKRGASVRESDRATTPPVGL